jgi:hypothetical protein
MQFFETDLWKKAESDATAAGYAEKWERIDAEFRHTWSRATQVAAQIAKELPQLTLHDEFHLNAVFEMGGQISGSDYELTPMEVVVFGMAVAVHDLAHTTTAYEGGLASIKETNEWKDAVVQLLNLDLDDDDPSPDVFENPDQHINDAALFITLRKLHADQAEKLLSFEIDFGEEKDFLLRDEGLRSHFGTTIGKIAASHHWGYERLVTEFSFPIGETFDTRGLGEVRPLVIACLLRTADACQIDQRRAYDQAKMLHRPEGVSLDHWQAQNQLAIPVKGTHQFASGLLLNSTKRFGESRIRSWWAAWELVKVADTELRRTKRVLAENSLPTFDLKYVVGSDSPLELSKYIQVENWTPLESKVRISDPEHVVQILGGPALYGENLWAPLRELLQNSADAIRTRRQIDPDYRGRILLRVLEGKWVPTQNFYDTSEHGVTVQVSDDGVGMSLSQMRNYLLDFGASLKVGPSIKNAFPKLLGKRIPSMGKYGIGFFSTSMISDSIWVRSRRYDKGLDSNVLLCFRHEGLESPFVFDGDYDLVHESYSTVVSLFLEKDMDQRVRSAKTRYGSGSFSWEELICFLAPCLEIDIYLEDQSGTRLVHSQDWQTSSKTDWLESHYAPKSLTHYLNAWEKDDVDNMNACLFEGRSGTSTGLAVLSESLDGSGFFVEGGLRVLGGNHFIHENQPFHGAIPVSTRLASRQGGVECISIKHLAKFDENTRFSSNTEAKKNLCMTRNRTAFKFDISDCKVLRVNDQLVSCRQLVDYMMRHKVVKFPFEAGGELAVSRMYLGKQGADPIAWGKDVAVLDAHHLFSPHESGELSSLTRWSEAPTDVSIAGSLHRQALENGYVVELKFFESTHLGERDGAPFSLRGVEVSLLSIVQIPEAPV